MTLASRIASNSRTPTLTLFLNGRRWRGVYRVVKSEAFGRGVTSFTVEGRDPPVEPEGGMPIRWTWGYDGFEVPGGTGYVVVPQITSYPNVWTLECQDVLWLASREQGPIQTDPLNSITAQAAIAYLLATYGGNPRRQIPDIKRPSDSGTSWTLGQLTPVAWSRTTALQAIQDIARTAGWWIYADAGGTVRGVQIERRPSDSPFRTLTRGAASEGGALLVNGSPSRKKDWSQVRNRITVRGASTGVEGAQLVDIFLADHALSPGVVAEEEFSFPLLEFIADVTAVAQQKAALLNRKPNTVEGRIKADPRLAIGMTLAIQDPGIRYSSPAPFFLYALQTTMDRRTGRFDQQLTLDGGTGSSGYSLIPEPVAVITYALERETVDGTAVTIVTCDGAGSYSRSAGEIVAWAWSTTATPYSGTASSGSGVTFTFILEDASAPFDVSLTVTDTSSKTGTADVAIPLAGDVVAPSVEAVIAAGGTVVAYTPDGGATWREEALTCTIVAESAGVRDDAPLTDAATYGALFTSTAQVRQTLDGLATTSTLLSTAGGTVTALHVNGKNASRVWRAVGTALQRSLDGGTTWASWGTLPATVRDIIEDPALENSVFVLAGANAYNTYRADGTSPGSSWSTLYAGPSGATARWFVRSDDGAITWICYTGTFTGSPLQRIEGGVAATGITGAEVRAIALIQTDPAAPILVAVDEDGQTYYGSALTGAMTAGPTLPVGGVAQHATASRQAPLAYIADFDSVSAGTAGALRKLVLGQGTGVLLPWRLGDSGEQYHMVRLASSGAVTAADFLIVPWGASGAEDKIWRYRASTGTWEGITPPQAGWYWTCLVVNPFNPQEWLLLGNDVSTALWKYNGSGNIRPGGGGSTAVLYYSADAGVTWSDVTLAGGGLAGGSGDNWGFGAGSIPAVTWRSTGGWYVAGGYNGSTSRGRIWSRAAGAVTSAQSIADHVPFAPISLAGGAGAYISSTGAIAGNYRLRALDAAFTASDPSGSAPLAMRLDGLVGGGVVMVTSGGDVYAGADTSAQPTLAYGIGTGASGLTVAAAVHGVYVPITTGGLVRITDVLGTPVAVQAADTGTVFDAVRVGQRDRVVVAAYDEGIAGTLIQYSTDGAVWHTVVGPAGMSDSNTGAWVEVIEQ